MKELIMSALLVVAVAVLGFVALDSIGGPSQPARVEAAPVAAAGLADSSVQSPAGDNPVNAGLSAAQWIEQPLHLLYTPDQRMSVTYDATRWYRLEYQPLMTLALQRIDGCQLELESNGEPLRVSGEWSQSQRTLGNHRFAVGTLTAVGHEFPHQVVYNTLDGNAYLVFTLRIGSTLNSPDDFRTCQADAEAVLATLHRSP